MIRVWHSYSCNNSSAYRMVARFDEAITAKLVAAELDEFFAMHAIEVDARSADTEEESGAQYLLGKKYGFTWPGLIYWGRNMIDNEPIVVSEGPYLVIQHDYCGGFDMLASYLRARGGVANGEQREDVELALLFRMPEPDPALEAELETMFAQAPHAAPFRPAWPFDHDAYGKVLGFRNAETVGLYVPTEAYDIPNIRPWMEGHGYAHAVIRIGEPDDARLFETIRHGVHCRSCTESLAYLHPGLHDVETPQFLCRACGGLYDVAAIVPEEAM